VWVSVPMQFCLVGICINLPKLLNHNVNPA
jgi:hypothetical protein